VTPSPVPLTLDDQGFPRAGGRPLALPPKERSALALLMRRQPGVVDKDDFATGVWHRSDMSDESLARCISRLRRALAPLGHAIESVYGTGYRLVPDAGRTDPAPHPASSAAAVDPRGAIDAASPASVSPASMQTFQHARQLIQQRTPVAIARAMALLRELSAREPGWTAAHVALAESLAAAVGWGQLSTQAAVDEGLAVLAEAEARDPATPGLHGTRGALLDAAWRFDEAEAAFARALAHAPSDADTLALHGRHLLLVDRPREAADQLRSALALAPHDALVSSTLARALAQSGRGDEAVAQAERTVADHPGLLFPLAFALAMRAQVAPHPDLEAPAWRLAQGADTPPFVWTVLSFVLARIGRRDDALDIIEASLLCSRTSTGEACLYAAPLAALGETARAAALLQRAHDEGCGMLAMVLRDPANAVLVAPGGAARSLVASVFGEDGS
jgi:DNA-binding winged helix-turn-helix (wHTH) protein